MRLIDADALKEDVEFQQEHMWPEDLSRRIPGMIDNAPTITAIPVEWLKDAAGRYEYSGCINSADVVMEVIKDWQQEQEAR